MRTTWKSALRWISMAVFLISMLLSNMQLAGPLSVSQPDGCGTDDQTPATPDTPVNGPLPTAQGPLPTATGVLNPVLIEQQGYAVSPNVTVRTDTNPDVFYDLPLDASHSWVGSAADISVFDLSKLYATNGTFDEGLSGINYMPTGNVAYHPLGWDALSNSTNPYQNQTASYDSTGTGFTVVENWGKMGPAGKTYIHYAGTRILWFQDIVNSPYTTQFTLEFSYLYARGPIGASTPGACSLRVYVDATSVWSTNLPSLASRGVWYSTGSIPLTISGAGSTFRLAIGLVIDSDMNLDPDLSYCNGVLNAAYITAYLDSVSFRSSTAPSFESMDMHVHVPGQSVPVTGSGGEGQASLLFDPYWSSDPLRVTIATNDTVSFKYRARMFTHYFVNSTWTTDITKKGVAYSSTSAGSNLTLCFYLGTLGEYEEFSVVLRYPWDWENATVFDPMQYDVTGGCCVMSGQVTLPGSAISLLGWWAMKLQSPNYAESLVVQKYDSTSMTWSASTEYRSGNVTRAQAAIGAGGSHPDIVADAEVTWRMPNGTIWAVDSVGGTGESALNSSHHLLGALNTTAGRWAADLEWTNGTEIALSRTTFSVTHPTSLTVSPTEIITTKGATVTCLASFRNADSGDYLMDTEAVVTADFAGTTVTFAPNPVRNWWEGEFDTSLIDYGVTTVTVTASLSYCDSSATDFSITIPYPTQLGFLLPGGQTGLTCGIGDTVEVPFRYAMLNDSGVDFANATVFYSGPEGGLTWNIVKTPGTGNYTLEILPSMSGLYQVTVQASRTTYEPASDSLLLSVEGLSSDLVFTNGTTEVISYGEQYLLFVRYVNSTGHGIENATVLVNCNPAADMIIGSVDELGDGYYSVLLSPQRATSFIVEVTATQEHYKLGYRTFSLGVTEILTVLQQTVQSQTIAIDRNITVTLLFTDEDLIPILGATVEVVSPPEDLTVSSTVETGGGYYEITVDPLNTGSYLLTFSAECNNYRRATTSLTLHIRTVPTVLATQGGLSSGNVEFGRDFEIVVLYNRTDDGSLIPGATIRVSTGQEGLLWDISEDSYGYRVRLSGNMTSTWVLYITANKTYHDPFSIRFVLTVNSISTAISTSMPVTSFRVTRTYAFNITYQMENGTGIDGADLFTTGDKADWFSFVSLGDGAYGVVFSPDTAATFRSYIHIARTGFQSQVHNLDYTVSLIPLSILTHTMSWTQGQPLDLVVTLIESDTLMTVSNSTVEYELRQGSVLLASGSLAPAGLGVYQTTVNVAWTDSDDLEFTVTVLDDSRTLQTPVVIPVLTLADPFIQAMSIVAEITVPTVLAVVGIVAWRFTRARRTERRRRVTAENLRIRQRFSDVQNILGLLVLHKTSGLPIYSKSLKPGLDEAIVSGFISAITLFRSEFKIDESHWEFGIVPISDVIRAVPTKNLICAMVTLSSPPPDQEARMLNASNRVAEEFDSLYEEAPTEYRDPDVGRTLEQIFDEDVDGRLLWKYRLRSVELPKDLECIRNAVGDLDQDGFVLDGAARILMSCGIEELKAYRLLWDALHDGILIPLSPGAGDDHEGKLD